MKAVNLKKIRKASGASQEKVARDLDLSLSTYRAWEQGINTPRSNDLIMLADYFGCTVDELLGRENRTSSPSIPEGAIFPKASRPAFAPLLGRIHAGAQSEPEVLDGAVELPASILDAHPRGFFLEVEGDCMDKVYTEYSYVFIDPDREPQDGSIAAVYIDGESVLRRMKRGANTLILSPESNNSGHKDIVITAESERVVESIGTVVWFQSREEWE